MIISAENLIAQKNEKTDLSENSYSQIVIKGDLNVYLLQSTEQSITFQGSRTAIKHIDVKEKNRTLSISKNYSFNDERVNVYLTLNSFEEIKTIGDVRIETPTNIWINRLDLDLSEETSSTFFVNSNQLNINIAGRGDLNLSGYIDTLLISSCEEAEVIGNVKSIKLICRSRDYSLITLEGSVFKSFLSGFDQGTIDLTEAECGMSSIVAFDNSKIKVTSIDVTDIYAFDKSSIHYRSANKAYILENSHNAQIRKEAVKSIARK